MEIINKSQLDNKLKNNEFLVAYIFADWCKVCKEFTPIMENEIVPNIKDVAFVKMSATEEENLEFLKSLEFETLPYMAVFHKEKFIGGDSMTSKEAMQQFALMVQIFKERQAKGEA